MVQSSRFVRILDEMAQLRAAMAAIDAAMAALEVEMMRLLHEQGLPWQAIADELGVSRQRISAKYSEKPDA